jgi:crotonobetaine/carnitine-CoA ligase
MLADGSNLTHQDLIDYLADRMPRFMIPRFVEFVDEFPRTAATMKIRKVDLRADAFNERTWDREAAALTTFHHEVVSN